MEQFLQTHHDANKKRSYLKPSGNRNAENEGEFLWFHYELKFSESNGSASITQIQTLQHQSLPHIE